jgi:pimeloyl-ACP methyl ester carboxylesterase
MLHGFGTTGDMWGHLASALVEDDKVVVPDLRGLGLSSKPAALSVAVSDGPVWRAIRGSAVARANSAG